MTSVYGIVSYLGGAAVGSEKGAGSSQGQGRRLVGDGRGAQRKQRARVVKKKGSGVRKHRSAGEVWG